jgi:hypothetical protein
VCFGCVHLCYAEAGCNTYSLQSEISVDNFILLNKRHPMPDFKLIKPHGHERDKVIMLQAALNQEHRAKVSRQR